MDNKELPETRLQILACFRDYCQVQLPNNSHTKLWPIFSMRVNNMTEGLVVPVEGGGAMSEDHDNNKTKKD